MSKRTLALAALTLAVFGILALALNRLESFRVSVADLGVASEIQHG